MREYTININFEVDAHDYDEAVDIAKAVRVAIEAKNAAHGYKLRNIETPHGGIEEI